MTADNEKFLVVKIADTNFGIRAIEVKKISSLSSFKKPAQKLGSSYLIDYEGEKYKAFFLTDIVLPHSQKAHDDMQYLLLCETKAGTVGLIADNVEEKTGALVNCSHIISGIEIYSGVAVLADEVLAMVLNVDYFFGLPVNEEHVLHKEESCSRLLLIDDSPFFRKFMQPVLEEAGFETVSAEDGLEGYNLLEEGLKVDAVISDIDMPHMSGLEFIDKCRKNTKLAHLPVIALTTHIAENCESDPAFKLFDGHVPKSERDRLVPAIKQMLNNILDNTVAKEAV